MDSAAAREREAKSAEARLDAAADESEERTRRNASARRKRFHQLESGAGVHALQVSLEPRASNLRINVRQQADTPYTVAVRINGMKHGTTTDQVLRVPYAPFY